MVRIIVFLSLFLVISFGVKGQKKHTDEIEKKLSIADSLFQNDKYGISIAHYRKVLGFFKDQTQRTHHYYLSQLGIVACYLELSELDKAHNILDSLKQNSFINTDRKYNLKAKVFVLFGKVSYNQGKYEKSRQYLETGLNLLIPKEKVDYKELTKLYIILGRIYWHQEKFTKQLNLYQKALNIAKKHLGKKSLTMAQAYDALGFYYSFAIPAYKKALTYYKKALKIKQKCFSNDESLSIASSYYRIGTVYGKRGNYEISLRYIKKSFVIKKHLLDPKHYLLGVAYSYLGYLYKQLESYDLSLDYTHKHEQIVKTKLGQNHPSLYHTYSNLVDIYGYKKDYQKALFYAKKKMALVKTQRHKSIRLKSAYYSMGFVYYQKGEYQNAINYLKKGITVIPKNLRDSRLYKLGGIYYLLGEIYKKTNSLTLAEKYFKKALILQQQAMQGDKSIISAYSMLKLSEIYLIQNKVLDASKTIQKSLVQAVYGFNDSTSILTLPTLKVITQPFTFRLIVFKAKCLFLLYQYTQQQKYLTTSLKAYQLSYQLFRKLQNTLLRKTDKIVFNESFIQLGQGAIQAYLEMYKRTRQRDYLEETYKFVERSKANTLKNLLNQQKALNFTNIPKDLLQKEHNIRIEITFWQKQLNNHPKKANLYRDSLFKYNRAHELLMSQLEKKYPKYTQIKHQNKTVSLTELQQKLDNNTVLLEYAFGKEKSHVFVITKKHVEVSNIAGQSTLQPLFDIYYNTLVGETRVNKFAEASYELYAALVKPIEKHIKNKQQLIIIAPSLESIPFEAFIIQPTAKHMGNKYDFSKLSYLIKHHQISYHYSATLWHRHSHKKQLVNPKLLAFAPFSTGKSIAINTRSRKADDPLPESGVEVTSIFNLFNQQKKTAQIYLAKTATKTQFLAQASKYNIIHLASHSEANIQNANLAKVKFATEEPRKGKFSSFLYSSEVYNLQLNTDLLVLSSCESGVGKLAKGEGVLSLARSFLYAGARNIVFSLWEVNDTYTRKLMVAFYKELLAGKSYRAALQAAQQTNLLADPFLHPKHWAGFVMVGE